MATVRPAHPALADVVSACWAFSPVVELGPATNSHALPVLPKRNPFMTINIGSPPALQRGGESPRTTASCTINGQMEATAFAVHPGETPRTLGVELTPLGLHLLTGAPAHLFTNEAIDAHELLGEPFGHEIAEQCAERADADALRLLEQALLARVNRQQRRHRYFDDVCTALHIARPGITAAHIASEVMLSKRTLQRAMREILGVGYRTWSGRLRFGEVQDSLRKFPDMSIEACAWRNGFVDASHLRRFVGSHSGRCPSDALSLLRGEQRVVTNDLADLSTGAVARQFS